MRCCVAEKHKNWCNDVEILVEHEGQTYCIFHAPMECEEKLERWDNELVFSRIEGAKRASKECNLAGTIFPQEITFEQFDENNPLPATNFSKAAFSEIVNFIYAAFSKSADFENAVFSEVANFEHAVFSEVANFEHATFSETANFEGATFSEIVHFDNAAFSGIADFKETKFSEVTNFDGATFSENTHFDTANFYGTAHFDKAIFSATAYFLNTNFFKSADFDNAIFSQDANFMHTDFSQKAYFRKTTFSENAEFYNITFSMEANFYNARFEGKGKFHSTKFANAYFHFANFEQPTFFVQSRFSAGAFKGCYVGSRLEFDRADLRGLSLLGAPIESFRFISCQWPKSDSRNIVYDARKVEDKGYFEINNMANVEKFRSAEKAPEPIHIEDLFRRLKKGAKNENDEMMASDWHYNEKEMQRLRLKQGDGATKCAGRWQSFFLCLMVSAYKQFSGYGGKPLRAFLWLLAFALLPAMAEPPLDFSIFPGRMLYYLPLVKAKPPIDAFGTLAHLWMISWQLLITVQAALFGFALRNKFRR